MNESYEDITSRIPDPPKWWDENAVPRYCGFSPRRVANIYANEVALARIACQRCGREFLVCFSQRWFGSLFGRHPDSLHYGDPPNMGCCEAGPTMNSELREVVGAWRRDGFDWIEVDVDNWRRLADQAEELRQRHEDR